VRGAATLDCITFAQAGTALPQEEPPRPMVSTVRKKEPEVDIQLPQHCRCFPGSIPEEGNTEEICGA